MLSVKGQAMPHMQRQQRQYIGTCCFGLLLGTEATVMTPDGAYFSFLLLSFLFLFLVSVYCLHAA